MFIEGFEHYLTQEEGLNPATARKYALDVGALWRWLEGQPSAPTSWADVTARHLRAFMAAQKPAPAHARRLIASWRKFWVYLDEVEKVDGLHSGPAELKRPKLPARLPRHLTVAEVARLLDAARRQPNTKRALRDWAILAFLYGSGCRISEALSLTFNRIQYDADRLPVSVRLIGKGTRSGRSPCRVRRSGPCTSGSKSASFRATRTALTCSARWRGRRRGGLSRRVPSRP